MIGCIVIKCNHLFDDFSFQFAIAPAMTVDGSFNIVLLIILVKKFIQLIKATERGVNVK